MKTFVMWKLPVLLGCFAAALILSPACKAQSDVNPDQFGDHGSTEPFRSVNTSSSKPAVTQTQARTSVASPAKQLVAARELSVPAQQNAVIIEKKRKTETRKSPQQ